MAWYDSVWLGYYMHRENNNHLNKLSKRINKLRGPLFRDSNGRQSWVETFTI